MIRVPRLKQNRHGTFCLRILWLDETGKRRECLHSLGTKQPTIARLLALKFNELFERQRAMTETPKFPNIDDIAQKYKLDLGKGIMEADSPDDHALMMKAIEAYKAVHGAYPPLQEAMAIGNQQPQAMQPRPMAKSIKFSEARAGYLREKEYDNAKRTLYEKGLVFDEFQGLFGDLEINLYDKATLVQWKNHEMNKGAGASRINKRLGSLNDFFNWCIGNGHGQHENSPVQGLIISKKSKLAKKIEHWKSFTNDDLKAIYGAGYFKAMPKPDHYWIPLIALYSGARLNEIASLPIEELKIIDGTYAMAFTDTKTSKVGRVVPIHKALLELGFWDYVEQVRSMGSLRLFPYLVDGNNGYGKNAGRQFAKWLDKLKITDPMKVFHSTRSTIITHLHQKDANPAHAMQLTGHEGVQVQNIHFQVYAHGMGLMELRDTLNRVVYDLDLEALKVPIGTWTKFLTRQKLITDRNERAKSNAEAKLSTTPKPL
jgi:integrase